ncbi:MAG: DUF92 domain-containing protein [Chloroflexota bacterium]|nr:DUF92 domain-containing protein [Chloroflexota bacterium]
MRSGRWPRPAVVAAGLAGSTAIGALAYRRGSLTRGGVAGATLVGTTILAGGGALPAVLLLTFFVSSSALSGWRRERKGTAVVEGAKGARRDLAQVLANGGVPAAIVVAGRVRGRSPSLPALIGALATVNADTWATEIGMLSRRPPRLVTTGRPVGPGTSGGVTPLGTGAAALGAALIGVLATVGLRFRFGGERPAPPGFTAVPLGVVAGLVGAFADSLLGATVQARFRCPVCGVATEAARHRCGASTVLTGGWRAVDNDAVNFASALCGAAAGALLARRFNRLEGGE